MLKRSNEGEPRPNYSGLSPDDHALLNDVLRKDRKALFESKRVEYADDPLALEEIDIYDIESPYGKKILEFRNTSQRGMTKKQLDHFDEWFDANYPLTQARSKKRREKK